MYTDEYLDEINESLELIKRSADDAQAALDNFRTMLRNTKIAQSNYQKLIEKGAIEEDATI